MNSVPSEQRGAASGMTATFRNTGMVLSIGVFFSLMIVGLSSSLPHSLLSGLTANGVPVADASRISHLPPVGTLFAAFLGYNPIKTLLGPRVLAGLPASRAAFLTGRSYFPGLISHAFIVGLRIAFLASTFMCLIAAGVSWMRGGMIERGTDVVTDGRAEVSAALAGTAADEPPPNDSPDEEWVPA